MSSGKSVFLVENVWGGHNALYLAKLSDAFSQAGCRVWAFCPRPDEVPLGADSKVQLLPLPDKPEKRFDLSYWNWLRTFVAGQEKSLGVHSDLVFIPYLDQALFPAYNRFPAAKKQLFSLYFPYNWSGIYFHPGFNQYPGSEVLFESRRCVGVAVLNPMEQVRLMARIGQKSMAFPDFADLQSVDDSPLIRELKQQAAGRRIVTNLGSLARRKGILTMLDIAQLDDSGQFYFFLAGNLLEHDFSLAERNRLKALAAKTGGNAWLRLQKIPTEAEYNGLLRASNIAYIGYQDFPSSSNLLTKAAAFGKPVLACQSGYIGHATRQYGLGLDFDEYDPAAGLNALKSLSNGFQFDSSRLEAFNAAMSEERLHEQIQALVKRL